MLLDRSIEQHERDENYGQEQGCPGSQPYGQGRLPRGLNLGSGSRV